jgi:NitT/TauT family transport system substrate-binding protein
MKPASLVFSVACIAALGMAARPPDAAPSPTALSAKPAQQALAVPTQQAATKSSPAPATKSGLQKVTLRLDWFVVGNNAMYYIAQDKGFYADEGLEVDIGPGKGSISTSQVVGSGGDVFGVADAGTAALAIGRGVPITVIASFVQTSPMCVTVLERSGIGTPKGLKGKRYGGSPGGASEALFPAFLKANGLTRADVEVVNVEPSAKWSVLSEGKVDAIGDFITSAAPIIEVKAGKKVRTFLYADSGVNVLGTGLIVNNNTMKKDPELVKRFVRATVKGWQYAQEHPEETVEAGLKRSEAGDKEVFMRQLTGTFKLLHTKNSKGKPLGWMSEKDWDESLKLLKEYLQLPGGKPASESYTNKFLP